MIIDGFRNAQGHVTSLSGMVRIGEHQLGIVCHDPTGGWSVVAAIESEGFLMVEGHKRISVKARLLNVIQIDSVADLTFNAGFEYSWDPVDMANAREHILVNSNMPEWVMPFLAAAYQARTNPLISLRIIFPGEWRFHPAQTYNELSRVVFNGVFVWAGKTPAGQADIGRHNPAQIEGHPPQAYVAYDQSPDFMVVYNMLVKCDIPVTADAFPRRYYCMQVMQQESGFVAQTDVEQTLKSLYPDVTDGYRALVLLHGAILYLVSKYPSEMLRALELHTVNAVLGNWLEVDWPTHLDQMVTRHSQHAILQEIKTAADSTSKTPVIGELESTGKHQTN